MDEEGRQARLSGGSVEGSQVSQRSRKQNGETLDVLHMSMRRRKNTGAQAVIKAKGCPAKY